MGNTSIIMVGMNLRMSGRFREGLVFSSGVLGIHFVVLHQYSAVADSRFVKEHTCLDIATPFTSYSSFPASSSIILIPAHSSSITAE